MVARTSIPREKDVLWHRRLCHRSTGYLAKNVAWLHGTGLSSADFVRGTLEGPCVCDACARTKAVMTPRNRGIRDRRSHDGEVSTDLYGPFPDATIQGSYHLQVFIRIASGYINMYGCEKKSDSVENLRDYLKSWPPPLTTRYHADGARELISNDISKILDSFSPAIRLSYSTAYAANENAFAERAWRTLADMAHPNLLMSELPFRFIEFAMQYAVWVLNRIPRQTDKGWLSPEEYEFQHPADLSMARRWGCVAYYTVPHQLRRKGQIENGIKGYFVGISEKQPYSWLIWDPKLNTIIPSSNVNFIETVGEDTLSSIASHKSSTKQFREVDFYNRESIDEGKSAADYQHLVGQRYYDRDEREVFETTSVVTRGQVIVANRRKVLRGKMVGKECDNHCIHVKDVEAMIADATYKDLVHSAFAALQSGQKDDVAREPVSPVDTQCIRPDPPIHHGALTTATSMPGLQQRRVDRSSRLTRKDDIPERCGVQLGNPSRGDSEARVFKALPNCITEALRSTNADKWFDAMRDEIDCIQFQMHVWERWYDVLPPGVKPLGTRFVFKIKEKDNPEDDIFRARLVVQGYSQQWGIDFDETFSPTTRANTLRLYLYLVLLFDMTLPVHLDAVKAYMNSDIDTDIWVYPPKDPSETFFKRGSIYKLKKALYGLKQAGRLWHKLAEKMLFDLGFKNLKSEPCFFYSVKANILTFVILYVDDMLISSQSTEVRDHLIEQMMKRFKFTNEGVVSEFLGIRIACVVDDFNRYILMDQEKMIIEKVIEFGLEHAKQVRLPMNPTLKLSAQDEPASSEFPYRQMVGSGLHIARWTRCDISFTVSQLSRYNSNPTVKSAQAACQMWVYLRDTAHLKFVLSLSDVQSSNFRMVGLSDSDWAGDADTRRSTTGWMVFIGESLINWVSQLQSFVSQSSMEAETVAANKLLNELLLMQNMFIEAGILPESQSGTAILIDNQAAIQAAFNPVAQGKTKHFDIQQFHLREMTAEGRVLPTKIHTLDNTSDVLTKAVDETTLVTHRTKAGIRDFQHVTKRSRSSEGVGSESGEM